MCVFYFTSVACLQAHAQQFTPARLLGMGGTGIAAHSGYQGALLNPATLVEGPQIEGGAYYQDVSGDGETSTLSGVGFLDNGPINFASGAFNYYRWRRRPSSGSKFSSEVFSAALAERFNPVWSLGLGFHLQRNSIANTENNEEKNLDVGLMFTPFRELGFGLVGTNLLPIDKEDIPLVFQRPSSVGFGVTYFHMGQFQFRGDTSTYVRGLAAGKSKYALGFESSSHEYIRARGGLARDDFLKENSYMLGFGFDGPKLRMDYAYKKTTTEPQSELHSVDLRLSF